MPAFNDTWFTGADVAKILKSLQVWPEPGTLSPDGTDLATLFQEQCDISAEGVKDDIEQKTGRKPLLVTRATIPHSHFERDGSLKLKVPATNIHSVKIGGNVVDASAYWTQPAEATVTGEPIESIRFAYNHAPGFGYGYGVGYGLPNRIVVDADFGSYAKVPPALWRTGCNMAALLAISLIQGEQDLASISEDGFSAGYDLVGPIDDKARVQFWPTQYKEAWRSFVRVVA